MKVDWTVGTVWEEGLFFFISHIPFLLPSSFFPGPGPYDPWDRIFPTLPFAGHALSVCLTGSDQFLFLFFFCFYDFKKIERSNGSFDTPY